MMRRNWMAELAAHYEKTRRLFPDEPLLILFDVDGTILDMRYMMLDVLRAFDVEHCTRFFRKLRITDIKFHENQLDELLAKLKIPEESQQKILDWYAKHRWSSKYILRSHQPFTGVLEVIRWLQIQPKTYVGLNTGRPESLRSDTLRSLNKLGEEYKVQFTDELLHMNPQGWEQDVVQAKIDGLINFQKKGYRVFAFVDNEPDNLKAVSRIDPKKEILLLHANTIFQSKRTRLPSNAVKGKKYDLTELIPRKALPKHIHFVWHGINDGINLRQFLASDINWGECDVRLDPTGSEVILRHDSFKESPIDIDEEWIDFEHFFDILRESGKSVKIDLKSGGVLIDKVLKLVKDMNFDEKSLWFNGNVERVQEEGFRKLASVYPHVTLQCPVDFLAPLIVSAPDKAKDVLDLFVEWGINRFSINWKTRDMRTFFERMSEWGLEVNIYNVPDLEAFLQAVLLMPHSITSDFNFPKWHYYGRGSGEDGNHYEYTIQKSNKRK